MKEISPNKDFFFSLLKGAKMNYYAEMMNKLLEASSLEEVRDIVKSEMLFPCPFCGQKETLFVYDSNEMQMRYMGDEDYDETPGYLVSCDYLRGGCGASSGYKETKEEAVQLWNTRK